MRSWESSTRARAASITPTRFVRPRGASGASSRTGSWASRPRARTCPESRRGRGNVSSRPLVAVVVLRCPSSLAMITIGCAGFSVPATRYFREFLFVEVQQTQVAQPGTGTMRRWRREAPPGVSFALLAPREIGQEGFRDGKVAEMALRGLVEVAKELDAHTAVFGAPPEV